MTTLVCFHHAGGTAAVFRGWEHALPPGYTLHAVQLPGRDHRGGEPARHDVDDLVAQLDDDLDDVLDEPHVLFGHSMGALLAYRLTVRRAARCAPLPEMLLAAAYAAPHLARPSIADLDMDTVDDQTLGRHLHAIGGMPEELLRRPEWLRPLLRTVRADLRVCASHRPVAAPPLTMPLHVFGGHDDRLVTPAQLRAWAGHAGAGFGHTLLRGGHFLVQDRQAGLLPAVTSVLAAARLVEAQPIAA